MYKKEIGFIISLFILSILLLTQSFAMKFIKNLSLTSAGLAPILLTSTLFVLVIIYFIQVYRNRPSEKEREINWDATIKQVYLILGLIVALLLTEHLGMLFSLTLFLVFAFMFIEKISLFRSILMSLGSILFIYIVFVYWFGMYLPKGIFI